MDGTWLGDAAHLPGVTAPEPARGYLVRSESGSFAPHCATSLSIRAESHRISAKVASSIHVSRVCVTRASHDRGSPRYEACAMPATDGDLDSRRRVTFRSPGSYRRWRLTA